MLDGLCLQYMGQVLSDSPWGHILEVELQTARQHRYRHLLWIRGGQNKHDVRRWLFKCLQHGVEGMIGEHVNLVDHIHLEATGLRSVHRVFKHLRHFVDAAI